MTTKVRCPNCPASKKKVGMDFITENDKVEIWWCNKCGTIVMQSKDSKAQWINIPKNVNKEVK